MERGVGHLSSDTRSIVKHSLLLDSLVIAHMSWSGCGGHSKRPLKILQSKPKVLGLACAGGCGLEPLVKSKSDAAVTERSAIVSRSRG